MCDRIRLRLNGDKKALLAAAGIGSVLLPFGIGLLKAPVSVARTQSAATMHYKVMLQALLVDRFRLSAHSEEQERNGYALIVDRTGSRLVAASAPCAEPGAPRDSDTVTCGTFFTGPIDHIERSSEN